jgi:hypothetical protein
VDITIFGCHNTNDEIMHISIIWKEWNYLPSIVFYEAQQTSIGYMGAH